MTDVLAAETLVLNLETFDAAQVAARNRALAVLSALPASGLRVAASLVEPPPGPWIIFGAQPDAPRLAIVALDDAPFTPEDDAALLVALDRLEPVLAAIETATGLSLEPSNISRQLSGPGLAVALDLTREGETACSSRLVLQIAAEATEAWPLPAIDLSADGAHLAVPIAGRLVLDAATVPAARVAALRTGDIVLTAWGPTRPGDARLILPDRRLAGRFHPAERRFTVITLEESAMTAPPLDAAVHPAEAHSPDTSPIAPADLPVALKVMLGEASLPLSELTGLRPGSTVVLGGSARDTTAVLLAGDHPIATGRLVAVGEAYGVLIEQLAKGA